MCQGPAKVASKQRIHVRNHYLGKTMQFPHGIGIQLSRLSWQIFVKTHLDASYIHMWLSIAQCVLGNWSCMVEICILVVMVRTSHLAAAGWAVRTDTVWGALGGEEGAAMKMASFIGLYL